MTTEHVARPRFAIRPVGLRVQNFRGLGEGHAIALERDLTVLVGANGAGKSSLLVAIEWCLFGAEVTKRSASGIAERSEWPFAHEGASGEVRVELELEVEGGQARLERSCAAGGRSRAADAVRLELPSDEILEGGEVADWLLWNGLPDWKAWRRAFCQHQELARARVTEAADRSAAIAGMLGLEEYRSANDALKTVPVKTLEEAGTRALSVLHDEQQRARERPGLEVRDLEERLERQGLAAAQAGEAELARRISALLADACGIAEQAGLDASSVPAEGAAPATLLSWAQDFPAAVRRQIEALTRERSELGRRIQTVASAVDALGPARRQEADAKRESAHRTAEHGTAEDLRAQLEQVGQRRETLANERRRQDAVGQLLRDALAVSRAAVDPGRCPVCDQARDDLTRVIESKLSEHGPDSLTDEAATLTARERTLREQIDRVESATGAFAAAQAQVASLEKRLRGQLPAGSDDGSSIDGLLQRWREAERGLDRRGRAAEEGLARHRVATEVVEILVRLRDARARVDAVAGEVSETPEFAALQRAIDDAAGFASDVEALSSMARELEGDRSERLLIEVNETLGTYFSLITGDPRQDRVKVVARRTATKVAYYIEDGAGRAITGLLNQAAFNALSLATLFASAERRARDGLPQFLVLDDPGQSLDEGHQAGLARAIVRCAGLAPVVVGSCPGALADALARAEVKGMRTYAVTRIHDGRDASIQEEVQ